ncbi:MAG: type II toxin-antitoxin system VapC family toxin [Phycisphaerales bacterium]|nr:type II toxin-antitoxin system VapC family toxin [Phycisphaerales bacterium]
MIDSGGDVFDRLVLDTSAYSHFRAGHPQVLDQLARAAAVVIPVTVLGELEAAFQLGRRARENRLTLSEFLGEPFVTVWPTTTAVARQYGRVFAELKRAGTPIPVNDVWIAAACLDCVGRLVTFDGDFERIPGLELTLLVPRSPEQ